MSCTTFFLSALRTVTNRGPGPPLCCESCTKFPNGVSHHHALTRGKLGARFMIFLTPDRLAHFFVQGHNWQSWEHHPALEWCQTGKILANMAHYVSGPGGKRLQGVCQSRSEPWGGQFFFNGPAMIQFAMQPRHGKKSTLYKRRWVYIAGMRSFGPLKTIFR